MRQRTVLGNNSIATVYLETDTANRKTVVKESKESFALEAEAKMLKLLSPHIRVPEVFILEDNRLVMEYIPNDSSGGDNCEEEIAEALAALHSNTADLYGLDFDTTIGPYRQSNRPRDNWIDFYREERVLDFTAKAFDEKRIGSTTLKRIEKVAAAFDKMLLEPAKPSLLHGDLWSGNVLTKENRFAALIDPATFYGHFEMELAFIGMFRTFGKRFYHRYAELRPIEAGFFETRADLYRIFPYLVHVRAFGESYLVGLENILKRFAA